MRRLLSILLLLVFGLPSVAPAFASGMSDESKLPACCRRGGAHHCAMGESERDRLAGTHGPQWSAKLEKCPCCPSTVVQAHVDVMAVPERVDVLLPVASHPKGVAQTRSLWRVARERCRGKRGPPVSFL